MIAPEPCCFMIGITACMEATVPKKLVSKVSRQADISSLFDGIEQAVSGVVDPDVAAIEVMQGQAEDAVNLFAMANVAGEGQSAIGMADAAAGSFGASGIAREHDEVGAVIGEDFGDRFADAHGSASNNDDFAGKICSEGSCRAFSLPAKASQGRRTIE